MMRIDSQPMTTGPRAGGAHSAGLPVLIQVPRVPEPRGRVRPRRGEDAGRAAARSWPAAKPRPAARPRRRLRPWVRRAAGSLMVLTALAGTLGMTHGSSFRPPVMTIAAAGDVGRTPVPPVLVSEGDPTAIGPALGAPVADAEVPVIFPGYVLPDDTREEPAHEGS